MAFPGKDKGYAARERVSLRGPMVRLVAFFEESPGWVDSSLFGDDANTLDRWMMRTTAVFTPSDRFTASLLYETQENQIAMLGYSDLNFHNYTFRILLAFSFSTAAATPRLLDSSVLGLFI